MVKLLYLMAGTGSLLAIGAFGGYRIGLDQHFIMGVIAAFLALAIALVSFNLSVQHRNRLTPYLSLAFLIAGTFELLRALFAKGILLQPAGSIDDFNYIGGVLGQTALSVVALAGIIRAVKHQGTWLAAPYYGGVGVVAATVLMTVFAKIPLPSVVFSNDIGLSRPLELVPCIGYIAYIVTAFKLRIIAGSARELLLARTLIPSLLVLVLAQLMLSVSVAPYQGNLVVAHTLKILGYVLALIPVTVTLWRYAEYSFQVAGAKLATIFSIVLLVLSLLSIVQFNRHEREIKDSDEQLLVGLLKKQYRLNQIEYAIQNYTLFAEEKYLGDLGSLWSLQQEIIETLRTRIGRSGADALNQRFVRLRSVSQQLFDIDAPNEISHKVYLAEQLLTTIHQLRNHLGRIIEQESVRLPVSRRQKISTIHDQLVFELSLLLALISFVIIMSQRYYRKQIQPVINLSDVAQRITHGQRNIDIIVTRKDELGMLGKNLGAMLRHLRSSVDELEVRVAERTAALSRNEQQLRNIMDNVDEGIISANDLGIIESVNPAAAKIFGYDQTEMIGQPIYKLIPEGKREQHLSSINRLHKAGGTAQLGEHSRREIALRKDGSVFPMEISVTESMGGDRRIFIAVLRDITEAQQAEKAMRESEQRLARFFDASMEGLLFHERGKVVDANNAALKLLDRRLLDVVGKNLSDFVSAEYQLVLQGKLDSHSPDLWETAIQRGGGSRLPVEIQIRDISFDGKITSIAVIRDITERKRAEDKLNEARNKLRLSHNLLKSIVESVPIRVFWKDKNLRFLGCNTLFAKDGGLKRPEDIIGKTDFDMGWMEHAELYQKDDQRIIDTGVSKLGYEEPQTTPDGKTIWLRTSKVPLLNDSEETIGVLGIYDDITQQKQAELDLQLSESRLKKAQEVARLGSWELDLISNDLWWSDECYRIFGVDKGVHNTYETFLSIVHPEDREFVNRSYTESVKNSAQYEIEHRLLMRDGSIKWVNERCENYYDKEGVPLRSVGTTLDITERKHAQRALDRHNQFTSRILDIVGSLVFVLDNEGRIVRFNRACEQLTGYTFDQVKDERIWDIMPDLQNGNDIQQLYQRPLSGNFPNQRRFEWPTKSGDIRIIDWINSAFISEDGAVEFVIAAGVDATDRLMVENVLANQLEGMERKVKERTRELDAMFTLSPDGFVMINEQGNVMYANPAFLSMTGMNPSQVIGIPEPEFCQWLFELCHIQENTLPDINVEFLKKNNLLYLRRPTERVLSCTVRYIGDERKTSSGLVLYFRDITHETEVDRMKSEFLSTAAHEFRTPLSSILGFSELLLSSKFNEEKRRNVTEIIHRQSINMKNMLDELLDLARIDARAGKDFYIEVDTLDTLITQVIEDTKTLANDGHTLKVNFADDWPLVAFDPDKLRQVLVNVLSNAYKYSPEGGEVMCSTVLRERDHQQEFGIKIQDQGIGMTPQEVSRVGERFYRVDTSGTIPGTGLGMSLVNEIMAIHKGQVEITSSKNKGTTVTLWLPVILKQPTARVV